MSIPLIPSPPTDNLYKFMALSGVVLLIFTPWLWSTNYLKQELRTQETLSSMIEAMSPAEYYLIKAQIDRGEPVSSEQRQMVEHFDAKKREAEHISNEFEVYEGFRKRFTAVSIGMEILGILLIGFGFPLWYFKVQRPLDLALAREAKLIR